MVVVVVRGIIVKHTYICVCLVYCSLLCCLCMYCIVYFLFWFLYHSNKEERNCARVKNNKSIFPTGKSHFYINWVLPWKRMLHQEANGAWFWGIASAISKEYQHSGNYGGYLKWFDTKLEPHCYEHCTCFVMANESERTTAKISQ